LAVQILSLKDEALNKKQKKYRKDMEESVLETASKLEEMGYEDYLERSEKFAD